jgi:hypothetical protein
MFALLIAVVVSAPAVEAPAEAAPHPPLSFSAALVGAWGLSPGDPFTLNVGARLRLGRVSFGLEAQPMFPGVVAVTAGELSALGVPTLARAGTGGEVVGGVRGFGGLGQLPVCLEWSSLSTCAVVAVGALSLDSRVLPLVSAGGRVAGEFPEGSPVRFRASVQLLGGLVRPAAGTFWQTSPVQLSVAAGFVADAL